MEPEYKMKLQAISKGIVELSKVGIKFGIDKHHLVQALVDNALLCAYHTGMTRQQTIQLFVDEIEGIAEQEGISWN